MREEGGSPLFWPFGGYLVHPSEEGESPLFWQFLGYLVQPTEEKGVSFVLHF